MTKNIIDSEDCKLWHLWDCWSFKRQQPSVPATRETILVAAFEEIYEHGYQAASLTNILKKTGATKGALYHHFKNKKELGCAVLDEVICTSFNESWIKPLSKSIDPIADITQMMENFAEIATPEDIRRGCPLNNLSQEMSPIDEDFRQRMVAMYDDWQQAIHEALERGIAAGNVRESTDTQSIALVLIASLEGCIGMAKIHQDINMLTSCGLALIERLEMLRPEQ